MHRYVARRGMLLMMMLGGLAAHAAQPSGSDYPIRVVPSRAVRLEGGMWGTRIETNRRITIPHLLRKNEEEERLNNLRRGAGLLPGPYVSRRYNDTDVYKLLEAIGFDLMLHPDPERERIADEQIDIIAKAQQPDGYIFPALTIDPANPAPGVGPGRWDALNGSHELYNHGHLIEAAVAYWQATGKRRFLDVAIKAGDLLCATFGPDKRRATSGHPEIEVALPKLYWATGDRKYVDLLKFFIDQRGHEHQVVDYGPGNFAMYNDRWYRLDDKPLIEQTAAQGHAVRATYLYAGLTDLAALTGEAAYREASERLWRNVVERQMYVMGGVGSVGGTEAFGGDYNLPNSPSYCESCASIGNALWNERLFRLTGDARYIDVMERIVYNGVLTGIGLSGDRFFYQNPQEYGLGGRGRRGGRRSGGEGGLGGGAFEGGERRGTGGAGTDLGPRREWFDVACCPANLARFVAQFPQYVYAQHGRTIYVNFFAAGQAQIELDERPVRLVQATDYPWRGRIRLTVEPASPTRFALAVRIPGWARGEALPSDLYTFMPGQPEVPPPSMTLNGEPVDLRLDRGYVVLDRQWQAGDTLDIDLPMAPRRVVAHEAVAADRGMVSLQYGPLVYCFEGADNGDRVVGMHLPDQAPLVAEYRPDLLGGTVVILARVGDDTLTAIPYQLWGNRGTFPMRIWAPRQPAGPPAGVP